MATEMLYEQSQFEPLLDKPWDSARVEDKIAAIVSDVDAAFDRESLWPTHDYWDEYREGQPAKVLYTGAAGVIWALDALRRRGRAETSLDLAPAAMRALELERAEPDAAEDERYRPGALLHGETGPLLVAFRLGSDPMLAEDLHALVRGNVANPTDGISWGAPGTLLVALAMGEWTGESRWADAARETATALRARRGEDGLWLQDDDYRGLGTGHGAAGNTLALLRFAPDETLANETAIVLAQHAVRNDGLANWPGASSRPLVRPRDGRICLQWCTGAPGVIAGNGFALLKTFARTGNELWLERARRFAIHALAQAERLAATNGRRR
jgi:hypothetical protein